ncbi:aminotransferase class I/II-fold pyridoxal phosphate-dependent enzyme [Candidatus Electrothrix sp.]|uniref:aminotransferase class I/II-fold pyridoxal phosphate-dependent enzyme n=1 Tax=Candidatus Electrothrix sp. TaxID=2170559 RepID=UPI00405720E9
MKPTEGPLTSRLAEQLQELSQQGVQRQLLTFFPQGSACLQHQNSTYLNLAGNDYLGLASNLSLLQRFYAHLEQEDLSNNLSLYGLGSGASRLMTGNHDQYARLEERLTRYYHKDKALIFNSGYHINIGLLPALARKGDLILADKLCHASLIDGMRLSEARMIRFPHLDYDRLEQLLKKHNSTAKPCKQQAVFIVTESIFSMDGDCADLSTLVRLKEQYGATLYVDEAHAVGVRGRCGSGLAEEQQVIDQIDLLVGTFGKAWGGQGAFVVCGETIYKYLVTTARSLIFTTALPPVNIHWLNFILPQIQTMSKERKKLGQLGQQLRHGFQANGLQTGGESNIIPVIIGDEKQTLVLAEQLRQQGVWIQAVRTPTVPRGTARLRLSLTANMNTDQLAALPQQIAKELARLKLAPSPAP